jgi:methyl-accepting chemotaxis protein
VSIITIMICTRSKLVAQERPGVVVQRLRQSIQKILTEDAFALAALVLTVVAFIAVLAAAPLLITLLAIGGASMLQGIRFYRRPSLNKPVFSVTTPFGSAIMPFDLEQMVEQLSGTADSLAHAVKAINDVTTQQSIGASEQADLITRTNTLLSDFLDLSERVQEQARALTGVAKQATDTSENGQAAIRQAIDGISKIRDQVMAIANTILALAQYTQRIDDIIASVSEIATQSNLLALNASIEAARAGAHGRGFAVVADEVRTLSQGSTQAAKQVRAILGEIQSAMKESIRATEEGLGGVDAGVTMTQQADSVMVQLAENISSSFKAVNRIYDIIRQQVDGLEEIAISMERIDRITQKNLSSTRAVEVVALELTRVATDLQITVGVSGFGRSQSSVYDDTGYDAEEYARQPDSNAEEEGAPQ